MGLHAVEEKRVSATGMSRACVGLGEVARAGRGDAAGGGQRALAVVVVRGADLRDWSHAHGDEMARLHRAQLTKYKVYSIKYKV